MATRHRTHFLISGRFNDNAKVEYMRKVRDLLAASGVQTFMVEAGEAGGSFGEATTLGLYKAKALIAFCTDDYGAVTGARYETYHELKYAHQKDLRIVPVQLCKEFPPVPAGDELGQAQNDVVLRTDLLRIVDIGMKSPEITAGKLKRVWDEMAEQEAVTESGHPRHIDAGQSSALGKEAEGELRKKMQGASFESLKLAIQKAKEHKVPAEVLLEAYEALQALQPAGQEASPAARAPASGGCAASQAAAVAAAPAAPVVTAPQVVQVPGKYGWELFEAAYFGQEARARQLLAAGADPTWRQPHTGGTALYAAAGGGHVEIVRVLLQHGADPRARDKDCWTALHAAAFYGHVEVVRVLLQHGADPRARDDDGDTPLDRANKYAPESAKAELRQLLS